MYLHEFLPWEGNQGVYLTRFGKNVMGYMAIDDYPSPTTNANIVLAAWSKTPESLPPDLTEVFEFQEYDIAYGKITDDIKVCTCGSAQFLVSSSPENCTNGQESNLWEISPKADPWGKSVYCGSRKILIDKFEFLPKDSRITLKGFYHYMDEELIAGIVRFEIGFYERNHSFALKFDTPIRERNVAVSVAWHVMFGRVFSQCDGQSKSTLTGATARRG
jgi:hypothetical protein